MMPKTSNFGESLTTWERIQIANARELRDICQQEELDAEEMQAALVRICQILLQEGE